MEYRMLIDGMMVNSTAFLDVVNPATGGLITRVPKADRLALDDAIEAARRAFPAWAALSFAARRERLDALADALAEHAEAFAQLLTSEQGKPLDEARMEMAGGIAALRYYASQEIVEECLVDTPTERVIQHYKPLGVVAAITPWNFPMLLLLVKLGPALITGNCVICKPAPSTPLTTLFLGELAARILPPGVINIIVDDNDLGAELTSHPGIAKISFTGSTVTGRKVMASAADTIKRLNLELGGNDAAIVLDDADIDIVAPAIFASAMVNAGQTCIATKRVYAPIALYDALCDALARLADRAMVDDGTCQGVEIGPIQNRAQYEKLLEYLAIAHADGTVIAGGHAIERSGNFIRPTIVRDISEDSRLVQEEQFGPILPVIAYDDLEDAIDRANSGKYGLAGTVWTSDPIGGIAVARRLDTGILWVNKHLDLAFHIPMAGAKQSGIGVQSGKDALMEYMQSHIINADLS